MKNTDDSTPNSEERTEAQACYIVAMHLHANRKVGKVSRWLAVLGVVAAVCIQSLWPLGIAVVAHVVVYFFIIQSCVRFVERATGMPAAMQALFSRQYKTDREFAGKVDSLANNAAPYASSE